MINSAHLRTAPGIALLALLILAILGFADAVFNYLWTGNGIHGSEGALLVVVSTFLMIVAAGLILFGIVRGGLRVLFDILLGLGVLGTAVAAYFLESWILLVLVILAALAWLVHIFRPSPAMVEVRQ